MLMVFVTVLIARANVCARLKRMCFECSRLVYEDRKHGIYSPKIQSDHMSSTQTHVNDIVTIKLTILLIYY